MLMGVLAASLLDYEEVFRRPNMACWMRPVSDPVVMFGPLLQPLRGVVFALVLFPVREVIFGRRRGWLVLWGLLVGLGVVNTFGPAPGSVEAMLYTVIPVPDQLRGYLEVGPQSGPARVPPRPLDRSPEEALADAAAGSAVRPRARVAAPRTAHTRARRVTRVCRRD